MISIVIPLYNKEGRIADTLRSVLAQTYRDFEIVIVNDGSTDRSVDEVAKFTDPRIRMINQANAGVSAARNRGIAEAKGDYIALLDADDEWKPDYLETQFEMSRKYPECAVFATNYEFRSSTEDVTPTILRNIRFEGNSGVLDNYFEVASTSHPPICSISIMARKGAFESVGGFPENVSSGEDLLTWARLAANYKIAYCIEPKARYYTPVTGPTGKAPADLQSTHDAVGEALIELSRQFPKKCIDEYVSFWYKMRSVINLGMRNRMASLRCAIKSIRYQPTNMKSWAMVVLSIMPDAIICKALKR